MSVIQIHTNTVQRQHQRDCYIKDTCNLPLINTSDRSVSVKGKYNSEPKLMMIGMGDIYKAKAVIQNSKVRFPYCIMKKEGGMN